MVLSSLPRKPVLLLRLSWLLVIPACGLLHMTSSVHMTSVHMPVVVVVVRYIGHRLLFVASIVIMKVVVNVSSVSSVSWVSVVIQQARLLDLCRRRRRRRGWRRRVRLPSSS